MILLLHYVFAIVKIDVNRFHFIILTIAYMLHRFMKNSLAIALVQNIDIEISTGYYVKWLFCLYIIFSYIFGGQPKLYSSL